MCKGVWRPSLSFSEWRPYSAWEYDLCHLQKLPPFSAKITCHRFQQKSLHWLTAVTKPLSKQPDTPHLWSIQEFLCIRTLLCKLALLLLRMPSSRNDAKPKKWDQGWVIYLRPTTDFCGRLRNLQDQHSKKQLPKGARTFLQSVPNALQLPVPWPPEPRRSEPHGADSCFARSKWPRVLTKLPWLTPKKGVRKQEILSASINILSILWATSVVLPGATLRKKVPLENPSNSAPSGPFSVKPH